MPNGNALALFDQEVIQQAAAVNFPISETELARTMLLANKRNFVRPEVVRTIVTVPFGSTVTVKTETGGRVWRVVDGDALRATLHDPSLFATLWIDSNRDQPVYSDIPLDADIKVDGAAIPFVYDSLTHEITNQGAYPDTRFSSDIDVISIDPQFVDQFFTPLFELNFQALRKFVNEFISR